MIGSVRGVMALVSPVQRHLLALFFGQPGRVYRNGELIEIVGRGVGSVHRQLRQFRAAGLIRVIPMGNQRYFTADGSTDCFDEIVRLVRNGVGLIEPIRAALMPFSGSIDGAWIHGAVADNSDEPGSPVDLVVVSGAVRPQLLEEAMAGVAGWLARPVVVSVVSPEEWAGAGDEPDLFIAAISQGALFQVLPAA